MPILRDFSRHFIGGLICLLGSLAIYSVTLAPTVQGFDSAELTVGAYTLGFVHPTGYPLYLLLGNIFSHLPLGNVGERLNLMSAVFGSLSVWMLYELLYLQVKDWTLAIASSFLLATSPIYWSQAVRAEVYTLHLFLILCALFAWKYSHQSGSLGIYASCFLLLGLGMGNHLTTLLLWASMLIIALFEVSKRRQMGFGASILGVLVASTFYLYFPLRAKAGLAIDYIRPYFAIDPGSLKGIVWIITGQAFRCSVGINFSLSALFQEAFRLFDFLWTGLLGFGLILAVLGWGKTEAEQPHWNHLLSVYFLFNLLAFISYHVVDKEAMFIPLLAIAIIWITNGVREMQNRISGYFPHLSQTLIHRFLILGILLVTAFGVWLDWPDVNMRENDRTINFARQVLNTVDPGSIVINHWVTASVFDYLRVVEKLRPDVTSFNLDFYWLGLQKNCTSPDDADQSTWFLWLEDHLNQTPLCFIEPLPPIPDQYQWVKSGSCWTIVS